MRGLILLNLRHIATANKRIYYWWKGAQVDPEIDPHKNIQLFLTQVQKCFNREKSVLQILQAKGYL